MSQLFINPVELLGLGSTPVAELDGATVRKARTRLRHELQLSDAGTIAYYGQQLDLSAVEMACADLDQPDRLRLWYRLAHMPALSTFLTTGQSADLAAGNAEHNGSLTADAELLDLIGPRYAAQYDRALTSAFQAQDSVLLRRLAALPLLFKPTQQAAATRTVGRQLREATTECERLTEQLDESDNAARVVLALRKVLAKVGWSVVLATLPTLLAGPRTALVLAVRNYAIALFNTLDDPTSAALQLLREAATVPTDAQTLDRVREDIRQIEEIERGQQHRARQQAAVQRFNEVITQCLAYQKQADAGTVAMTTLTQWSAGLTPLIAELNAETEVEIAKARDFLASELRDLSISIWNNNQRNGHAALAVLLQGLTLRIQATTRTSLQADQERLQDMVAKSNLLVLPPRIPPTFHFPLPPPPPQSSGGIPGWIWVVVVLLVIFLISKCDSHPITSSNYPEPVNTVSPSSTTDSTVAAMDNQAATYEPEVSKYEGNQLKNGASPLDKCFGKGKYGGPCWVKFDNSANATDAIMCLVSTKTGRTVRNEYIRGGTVFKMTHVPRGSYYIKGFYGTDWNPTRRSACGTKGYFDSNQSFTASPNDAFEMISDARGFSTNTITLYGVANGNMSQQPLSAEQFFQQ